MTWQTRLLPAVTVILIIILAMLACAFGGRAYIVSQLKIARRAGVYPNPQAGMQAMIAQGYRGIQKVEIVTSGVNADNGSQPHVWFVVAHVWAQSRADGSPLHPMGYDNPGSFFLRLQDGWVTVPEAAFPVLIGLGMDVFALDGRWPARPAASQGFT